MNLTREEIGRLYAGEEVAYATDAHRYRTGRSYAIRRKADEQAAAASTNSRALVTHSELTATGGRLLTLKLDRTRIEEKRLLHQNSERGYTSDPHRALRGEPEAVPVEAQERIVAQARLRGRDRLRERGAALDALSPTARLQLLEAASRRHHVDLRSETRLIRHLIESDRHDTARERLKRIEIQLRQRA